MKTAKQSIRSAHDEIITSLKKICQIDSIWLKFRQSYVDKKNITAELTVFYIDPKGKETNLTVYTDLNDHDPTESLIELAKVQLKRCFENHSKTILHL